MTRFVVAFALSLALVPSLSAQAIKTGERTTGMTKQCYYNHVGSEYTITVSSVELCPLSVRVPSASSSSSHDYTPPPRRGVTALKTGEETTGMTKQCYYSFGANVYTKTISSVALCPLSISTE